MNCCGVPILRIAVLGRMEGAPLFRDSPHLVCSTYGLRQFQLVFFFGRLRPELPRAMVITMINAYSNLLCGACLKRITAVPGVTMVDLLLQQKFL